MARPRQRPVAEPLQRLLDLSHCPDIATFARAHALSVDTVRAWDVRRAVPAARLAQFAEQYGVSVRELLGEETPDTVHAERELMQRNVQTMMRAHSPPATPYRTHVAGPGQAIRGARLSRALDLADQLARDLHLQLDREQYAKAVAMIYEWIN